MDGLTKAAYYLLDARIYLLPYLPVKPICDIVDAYSRSTLLFENILFSDTSIKAADLLASEDPKVQNWCKQAIEEYNDFGCDEFGILRFVLQHAPCVCLRPQCFTKIKNGVDSRYGTKCICTWPIPVASLQISL